MNKLQKWKGYFCYAPNQNDLDYIIKVNFFIEVVFNNNSFEGVHQDEESFKYFNKQGIVKGYVEDDFINFTIDYPCLYYLDENGKIKLDKKRKHPLINYIGTLESRNLYTGHWEMETIIELHNDGDIVDINRGTWTLEYVSSRNIESIK